MAESKAQKSEHEKRAAAAKKAARTRRRNQAEDAKDPTERTKPLGRTPSVEKAAHEDMSGRTAGLAVEKSGPGPAGGDKRTSEEAQIQGEAQKNLPAPDEKARVKDAQARAKMEAERLAAARSKDDKIAPKMDVDKAVEEALEQRKQAAAHWAVPKRFDVGTAVGGEDGEVQVSSASGYVFLGTGSGTVRLTAAATGDLVKKLQMAFQAVS